MLLVEAFSVVMERFKTGGSGREREREREEGNGTHDWRVAEVLCQELGV